MKLTAIFFSFLYLQVSSSFLDDFRSAISNVERGFGKLLTDVVMDVEETIHCTISAVEQVLVLNGLLDKTSTYRYRCRDLSKPIQPTPLTTYKIRDQRSVFDHFNKLKNPNIKLEHRNLPKHISMELGKSIANVNKTINEILGHRKANNNLGIVSKTMKDETTRLTEISKILKRELENISSNIRQEINKIKFGRHESNLGSAWDEFKTLHDIQKSSKNTTEVNEIRNVLNNVVNKLHLNANYTNIPGDYNLKEIRKILQRNSDGNDKNLENDSNGRSNIQDISFKKSESETVPMTFADVAKKIFNNKNMNPDNHTEQSTGKSLFSLELDSFDYFAPLAKANTNNNKAINDAKKIIEDSQHADKILNDFLNEHQSGYNIFNVPDPFNFNKS